MKRHFAFFVEILASARSAKVFEFCSVLNLETVIVLFVFFVRNTMTTFQESSSAEIKRHWLEDVLPLFLSKQTVVK